MKTLFVASGTPGGQSSGSGTADQPIRVADARDFDRLLHQYRRDTLFQLLPGTYETRGAWAFAEHDFCNLGDGCGLVGLEGPVVTTLRLADDYERQVATAAGNRPAQKIEMLLAGSRCAAAAGNRIEGLTIDARGGRHADGTTLPTVALHVFASRSVLRNLEVLGVDGKWEGANEGFGILVNNCGDTRPRPGGHLIEDCRVECLPGSYVTGLYCGVTHPAESNPPEPSQVVRCSVTAPWAVTGRHAHAAFAANAATTFSDCAAAGFDRFFFCDTGSVADVVIERCRGEFGYCAVDLPGPVGPQNPILHRKNILVRDSTFTATNPRSDHVVLLNAQDGSPGSATFPIQNLKFDGCVVVSDNPGVTFYAVSVKAAKASAVRIVDCTLPARRQLGVWDPTPKAAVGVV